jgi:RNA polymerase sigma-70 factor (ECF subfamily)
VEIGEREQLEGELRRRFDAQDMRGVATLVIERYGPEIFGLLLAIMRVEDDAAEVFAEFSADLWKDLPGFRWECTLRTWAYTVARHRLIAFERDPARRPERRVPLSRSPEIEELAARARTATFTYLRSEAKQGVVRLRERLPAGDQMLLILRVDRDLSWREIARIMADAGEPALRKRFERVKTRLREMAREEKLSR